MRAAMADLPCLFSGRLAGEELEAVYASSDIFVFPSTTDTFGNVVLEAQASGIPVVVTDRGGPAENVTAGKTGLVVKADCVQSIVDAVALLIDDPQRRRIMGNAARQTMEGRSFEAAFNETWKLYGQAAA